MVVDGVFYAKILINSYLLIILKVDLWVNDSEGLLSFLLDDERCPATGHKIKVINFVAILVKFLFFLNVNQF